MTFSRIHRGQILERVHARLDEAELLSAEECGAALAAAATLQELSSEEVCCLHILSISIEVGGWEGGEFALSHRPLCILT